MRPPWQRAFACSRPNSCAPLWRISCLKARRRPKESAPRAPAGQSVRDAMARWIVDEVVPVDALVPEAYKQWRPPVRDAMMFVVKRLSPARLAPKLLEQIELPAKTSPEVRLLRLIAKVPGLQKLGQV